MGSGINISLYTARSSLLARQNQMAVISNNLAKADMPGYHRQTATLENSQYTNNDRLILGTGVHVSEVLRSYDQGLETSLQQAMQDQAEAEVYALELDNLEKGLAPESDSPLQEAMGNFADALQSAAARPESLETRREVLTRADELAEQFNDTYRFIDNQMSLIASATGDSKMADSITKFNQYATNIADINDQIVAAESRLFSPTQALDLRDERDALIKEMSKIADISHTEEADGSYTLTLDGRTFVTGGTVSDSLALDMGSGNPEVDWTSDSSTVTITEGEITGYTRAFTFLETTRDDMQALAAEVASLINTRQTSGFDLDDNAGNALFDASTPGSMSVLFTNANELALSPVAGSIGNGQNAQNMWNDLNAASATLNNDSPLHRGNAIVNNVAREFEIAEGRYEYSTDAVNMFQDSVNAVSGVNIDEEMINMLEVQRAFQASGRLTSTIDQMMEVVINII